jgi:signal transduction histidine kinase
MQYFTRIPPPRISIQIALFALMAIVLVGATSYLYYRNTQDFIRTANEAQRSQRTITMLTSILSRLKDAETGERGYIITNQERFLEPYTLALSDLPRLTGQLESMLSGKPDQLARFDRMQSFISRHITFLSAIVELVRNNQLAEARDQVSAGMGKVLLDEIRQIADEMITEEQNQLNQLEVATEIHAQATTRSNLAIVGIIVLVLIAGLWSIIREVRRKQQLENELVEVNQALTAMNEELNSTVEELNATNEKLNQTNTQLNLLNEQVTAANQELETFTYTVSHDLRTPLRTVVGFTELLLEEHGTKLDAEGQRLTGIIARNALFLGELVDDLLEFARLGRKALVKSDFSVLKMLDPLIAEEKKQYPDKTYIVVVKIDPAADRIVADAQLIRQVWVNLLSNAFKFSRTRENPVIEIHSQKTGSGNIFSIRDNGVGFNPAYQEKLFTVFQRLHSHHDFGGTGVGLAIVQRIISSHGGRVWANAAEGQGATFYFTLPSSAKA